MDKVSRIRQIALPFIVAIFLSCFTVMGLPNVANANVGCWGDWCSGQDPNATGCALDAVTVATGEIRIWSERDGWDRQYGTLELRWSNTCKTEWVRYNYWGEIPIKVTALQETGYTQTTHVSSKGGYGWTPMIYSPSYLVRADISGGGYSSHMKAYGATSWW